MKEIITKVLNLGASNDKPLLNLFPHLLILFLTFLIKNGFHGVELIYNVVSVLGVQQR